METIAGLPAHVVVTPAYNEASCIADLIASLRAQTHPPRAWVIVDDDSNDGTAEIVRGYLPRVPFLRLASLSGEEDRATGARDVLAFRRGLNELDLTGIAIVTKLDADLVLPPDYFAELLERFVREPRLGLAGGTCYVPRGGGLREERVPAEHVRGALKSYRVEVLQAIGGLEATLGWDTIDELRVSLQGWRVRSFRDLHVVHRRPTGATQGILRGRERQGLTAWLLGYDPFFMMLRCMRAGLVQTPFLLGGVAMARGYLRAARAQVARATTREEMAYLRARQRCRLRRRCG